MQRSMCTMNDESLASLLAIVITPYIFCLFICRVLSCHMWNTCDLNTNNNIIIPIISRTMFMVHSSWHSHCKSSPGSFVECRAAPGGRRPSDQANRLERWARDPPIGSYSIYMHHRHLLLLIPKASWYSFYHLTEDRRLSRLGWLVTYRDCLPVRRQSPIQAVTGPGVEQLRWSRPTRLNH